MTSVLFSPLSRRSLAPLALTWAASRRAAVTEEAGEANRKESAARLPGQGHEAEGGERPLLLPFRFLGNVRPLALA